MTRKTNMRTFLSKTAVDIIKAQFTSSFEVNKMTGPQGSVLPEIGFMTEDFYISDDSDSNFLSEEDKSSQEIYNTLDLSDYLANGK